MFIFEVVTFFLTLCLPNQLNFFVTVLMYKIHDFDETSFLLVAVALINENLTFSVSIATIVNENNNSSQLFILSIQTTPEKRSQTEKGCSEDLLQRCIFHPIAKEPNPNHEVKMQQKIFLGFYYHLSYNC